MSKNIVFEGWLTKSPPNRRIWRTRWRRRWFALRQSGELPGQYFLDYYADRNCRRLKGTINLDLCEQVDAGLHMERHGQAPLNPNLRGSVFTIQTQRRTYHLEADCEADMEKWVDAICRVCGLRATDDVPPTLVARHSVIETYQNNLTTITAMNGHYEYPEGTSPYIPISECITGVRAQDEQRHFTFEPKTIAMGTRNDGQHYVSQPHIRNNSELSENDSNMSDEDDTSLHASHTNIHWAVTKSFTKLSVAPNMNGPEDGPPVPPRPPKTFAGRSREVPQKDPFQGPKIQEPPAEVPDSSHHSQQRLRVPRRMSQGAPSSPRQLLIPVVRCPEEEEEFSPGHASMQYCNLSSLPPAVDRNLKPRHSSHSSGHINHIMAQENETCQFIVIHSKSCNCSNLYCGCGKCRSRSVPRSQTEISEAAPEHPRRAASGSRALTSARDLEAGETRRTQSMESESGQQSLSSRPLPPPPQQSSPPQQSVRPQRSAQRQQSMPSQQFAQSSQESRSTHSRQSSSSSQRSQRQRSRLVSRRSRSVPLQSRPLPPIPELLSPVSPPGGLKQGGQGDEKPDVLQYLDLDLHTSKPPQAKGPENNNTGKKVEIAHGKSASNVESDAYKTVDFLKTEAFNITRQDAEALRSFQH